VVYWKLDENSGTSTVYDSSGNGRNGTLSGNFTESDWVTGRHGAALNLDQDATSDEISITAEPVEDLISEQFTISFWTNPGATSDRPTFGFTGSGSQNKDNPVGSYDGFLNIGDNSTSQTMTALPNAAANTWTHYAITDDGTDYKVYIDGIETDSATITIDPADVVDRSFTLGESGFSGGFADWYVGKFDEFKIYNYARTVGQIVEDMNAGHPAPGSPVGSAIGHWKFDEGYGDTAYDSSPQNNDGNLQGSCPGAATCPSWTNSGKFGKALDFDGTNDNVEITTPSNVSTTGDSRGTITFWMQPDWDSTTTTNAYIMTGVSSASYTDDFAILFCGNNTCSTFGQSNGDLLFLSDDNDANQSSVHIGGASYSWSADDWVHITAVWDDTLSSNDMRLYVNGQEPPNTNTNEGSLDVSALSLNSSWYIGDADPSFIPFDGTIDEVKIYNFALTSDQVKTEYNQGKAAVWGASSTDSSDNASWSALDAYCPPGQGSSCTAPVLEWKFDENTGTSSVNDTSGNGNSGTMNSFSENSWVPGKYSSALTFNGSSTYIVDSSTPISAYPFTIGAWLRSSATSGVHTIVGLYDNADDDRYQLLSMTTSDGLAQATSRHNGAIGASASSTTVINDGVWHYLVGVFTSATDRKIFVDGVEEGSNTTNKTFEAAIDNATAGRRNSSDQDTYFDGEIDQVRMYNYARTPEQIAWEYNRGGPYAWWKLDDNVTGHGQTVYDSSGRGNNGLTGDGGGTTLDCTIAGKRNTACSLDGSNDRIRVSEAPFDFSSGPFSIALWFKTSVSVGHYLLSKNSGFDDNINYLLYLTTGGGLTGSVRETGNTVTANNDFKDFRDGTWHHAAMVVTTSDIYVYVDGQMGSTTGSHSNSFETNDAEFQIGASTAFSAYLEGQIDDVKIFRYALTDEQVRNEYNQGALFYGPNEGSP
jgi:hypothetical protein